MTISFLKHPLVNKLSLFFIVLLLTSLSQLKCPSVYAADTSVTPDEITVSTTIGTATGMTVFGYAPASSTVSLFAHGIFEERKAEPSGYFSFDKIYTTTETDNYPEICVFAYIGNLSTQPTCIPSLPAGNNIYEIGPVILSPIITIEQNIFTQNSQVALNGITIPNSLVKIFLAENGTAFSIVSKILAYSLPTYEVTSDSLGKFQFNLPSNTPAKWKVYASTTYLSSASAKSNTLNFTVESNTSYFIRVISETVTKVIETTTKTIKTVTIAVSGNAQDNIVYSPEVSTEDNEMQLIKSRVPYLIILIEVSILIILVIVFFSRRKHHQNENR